MTSLFLADIHRKARAFLAKAGIETAALDARLLVEWITDTDRLETIRNPDRPLMSRRYAAGFGAYPAINGESVHRIIGKRAFFGWNWTFTRYAGTAARHRSTGGTGDPVFARAYRGTGYCRTLSTLVLGRARLPSHCLISCRQLRAGWASIFLTGALDTARDNAHLTGVSDRFAGLHSDWFSEVNGSYRHDYFQSTLYSVGRYRSLQPEVAAA